MSMHFCATTVKSASPACIPIASIASPESFGQISESRFDITDIKIAARYPHLKRYIYLPSLSSTLRRFFGIFPTTTSSGRVTFTPLFKQSTSHL